MMNLSHIWSKLSTNKIVQSLTDNYHKFKRTINPNLTITQIIPRLYHIDYPQAHHTQIFAQHIADQPYQILNLSEYSYEPDLRVKMLGCGSSRGEVHHLCFQFYTNSPFYQLLEALDRVQEFLRTNPNARIYVHCQESKIRSAVFLSCYLLRHRAEGISCISEAIIKVNRHLGICLQQKAVMQGKGKYANHHLLIRNFINYQTNPQFINQHELQLKKIVLSNPPSVLQNGRGESISWKKVKVYAELRSGPNLVWKGVGQKQNEGLRWILKASVADEFLIVVKYVVGKQVYRMLRVQLNTNFIFDQLSTIQQNNIDLSPYVATQQSLIQINLSFNKLPGRSKLADRTQQIAAKKARAKQDEPKVVERVSQSNFALESHEESHNEQTDLQARISRVMQTMAERQLQKEQDDDEGEQMQDNQLNPKQQTQPPESYKQSVKIEDPSIKQQQVPKQSLQLISKVNTEEEQGELSDDDLQAYLLRLQSQAA